MLSQNLSMIFEKQMNNYIAIGSEYIESLETPEYELDEPEETLE